MKLNALGRAGMNNRIRALAQRRVVIPAWQRLDAPSTGGRFLEIGCGGGAGGAAIRDAFAPQFLVGLDLDSRMLDVAKKRMGMGSLLQADAEELPAAGGSFDAVFDFGAIHLMPGWPRALQEVRRVLKPHGRYYFEWVTIPLVRIGYRLVTEGLRSMSAPQSDELLRRLKEVGFVVGDRVERRGRLAGTQFVGDLIGVGRAA